MLTLMMYALCACLAFKGVEIFQMAITSASIVMCDRKRARKIGWASLIATWVLAAVLAFQFTAKGWELDQVLRQMSQPPAQAQPQFRQQVF